MSVTEVHTTGIPVRPDDEPSDAGSVERTAGATIDELVDATGWQKHSVHGVLSRLRSGGFAVRLESTVGRKAYRLAPGEA